MEKRLAQVTSELAAASIGSKGPVKGNGDKGKGKSKGKSEKPCYHFHTTRCTRRADCYFSHAVLSKEEKSKLVKPTPSASRATSPSGWSEEAKTRSDPKGKGKGKTNSETFCYAFAIDGKCSRIDCTFAHLTANEVTAFKAMQAKTEAKAKALAIAGCVVEVCASATNF